MGNTTRSVGRPRSEDADRKILDAACELLVSKGYDGLHLEHVAARAGVGKATLYRRWSSKEHLAEALLEKFLSPAIAVPDLGDTKAELKTMVMNTVTAMTDTPYGPVVLALLSQIGINPELGDMFRENVVKARRFHLAEIVERGVERGDLRADCLRTCSAESLIGPLYYRLIFGGTLDEEFADTVIRAVFEGCGTRPTN